MATLMLVSNPTRKKGKAKMATRRKPRTAAQKRATAKLVARNRARRAAPARKRRARRTSVATTARRVYRRASSAARRTVSRARRSYRRGARTRSAGFGIVNLLKQAGVAAVGAVAVDIIYNKLPIPATMKIGYTGNAVKAAATIGIGMLAARFVNRQMAHTATVGALTVQLADIVRSLAAQAGIASVTDINGIDWYSPAQIPGAGVPAIGDGMGEYVSGVGEYVSEYVY